MSFQFPRSSSFAVVMLAVSAAMLGGCVIQPYQPSRAGEYDRGYRNVPRPPGGIVEQGPYGRPSAGIGVLRATYGTRQGACDATWSVAQIANGQWQRDVLADNNLCGDPHRGVAKTLDVVYRCGNETFSVVAREGQIARLICR